MQTNINQHFWHVWGYNAVMVIHVYLATGSVLLAVAVVNPVVETTVIGRFLEYRTNTVVLGASNTFVTFTCSQFAVYQSQKPAYSNRPSSSWSWFCVFFAKEKCTKDFV